MKEAYVALMKLKIQFKTQEDKCMDWRKKMNEPAIEKTYNMNFQDKGFETEFVSYKDTTMMTITENKDVFNSVPITFDSPVAEIEEFKKTLQDEQDNFWSPFEAKMKHHAKSSGG